MYSSKNEDQYRPNKAKDIMKDPKDVFGSAKSFL